MPTTRPRVGQSPFLVKGMVYEGAKQHFAEQVPGGLDAIYQHICDLEIRAFFQQEFIPSEKYDILPIIVISESAARAAGLTHEYLVTESARWLAERDINGIFKLFLKLSSPRLVASLLPKASMQYFCFGQAKGTLNGTHRLDAYQSGIPTQLTDWMVWVVHGFAPVALQLAGAKNVVVQKQAQGNEGMIEGFPICKLSWNITWTDDG